jgi:hypothetical protein
MHVVLDVLRAALGCNRIPGQLRVTLQMFIALDNLMRSAAHKPKRPMAIVDRVSGLRISDF